MKSFLTLFLSLIGFVQLLAQETTYFNEWIDYEQTYHKFYIEADGIYRISYEILEEAGLTDTDPTYIHLYSRGKEVPFFTTAKETWTSEDYIEFYGKHNDGSFDTQLFENPEWQLHDRKSQFTKQAAYFLVADVEAKRIPITEGINDLSGTLPQVEKYFMYDSEVNNRNIFFGGIPTRISSIERPSELNMNFADFERGEGFTGIFILGEQARTYRVNTFGVYQNPDAPMAYLSTKVVGIENDFFVENDHHLQVIINDNTYIDETFEGYDAPTFQASIAPNDLNNNDRTDIAYRSVGDLATSPHKDIQSVAYAHLSYPRQFDFTTYESGEVVNSSEFHFELQHLNEAYFEVSHFNGSNEAILYDLTNDERILIELDGEAYKIHLPESSNSNMEAERNLYIINPDAVHKIESLQSLQFTDYTEAANQGDYILLSHSTLHEGETDWVEAYADYRSTEAGGNFGVVVVSIEELYDQFAHGIVGHPLSIRNFVNFAVDNWSNQPEYLFLMGKGIGYRSTTTPSAKANNLIPTFGHQPSDIMLAVRGFNDYRPQLGVGRLSAQTPEDVENYLSKIQQYENIGGCEVDDRDWRKKILFQGEGANDFEFDLVEEHLASYQPIVTNGHFGGEVLDVQIHEAYSDNFETRPFIEEGIGILHFAGNSSGEIWKTDILQNVKAYKQEAPRFPIIFSNSSFVGNTYKSINSPASMAENWVLARNKGAVAFLGEVSFDWREAENVFYKELYEKITQSNYNQPIGKSLKETIEAVFIANPNAPFHDQLKIAIQGHSLEGDPALIIGGGLTQAEFSIQNGYEYTFIDTENDYSLETKIRNDLQLFNPITNELLALINGRFDLTELEEVLVQVRVTNLGKVPTENLEINLVQVDTQGNETLVSSQNFTTSSNEVIYKWTVPSEEMEGINDYDWVVTVNPNQTISEDCLDNNSIALPITSGTSSISNNWRGGEIQLFPNPVNDQLRIVSSERAALTLQLVNIQGQLIQRQFLHEGSTVLNLSALPNGIYWVRLTGGQGVWNRKIVKQ